jgi:histidine triad (HIT) family protein
VHSHEPPGYACPFCLLQRGITNGLNAAGDVVAVTERAFARISPRWWPANPGHVLVIPRAHVESLYDIGPDDGHAVWDLTQKVAVAIRRAYGCDGVSTRQHNEPAGNQDVWHLHVHVFPRWDGDDLYASRPDRAWAPVEERAAYADRLRGVLDLPTGF